MNREIRQLGDDLINVLNSSNVPVEAKRLVVLNIVSLLEKEADRAILAEIKETITERGEMENAEST